eukprot:6182792-Pleurochrysis_carterae.AAC.1
MQEVSGECHCNGHSRNGKASVDAWQQQQQPRELTYNQSYFTVQCSCYFLLASCSGETGELYTTMRQIHAALD